MGFKNNLKSVRFAKSGNTVQIVRGKHRDSTIVPLLHNLYVGKQNSAVDIIEIVVNCDLCSSVFNLYESAQNENMNIFWHARGLYWHQSPYI